MRTLWCSPQYPLSTGEEDAPAFSDYRSSVLTFANVRHINTTYVTPYDTAILGAPFDTATTSQPGARFGLQGIRLGLHMILIHTRTHYGNWAKIIDWGDTPSTLIR